MKVQAIAPAAMLLASLISSAGGCNDPKVYRIAGPSSATSTYRILFLGAGFDTNDELESYRFAAEQLANGIRTAADPYKSYAGYLSFWRIDVRTGPIDTTMCSGSCGHTEIVAPPPAASATPLETLNPSGPDVVDEDLHVSLCYTSTASPGPCRLLWANADGQRTAAELATYAPDIDVVVILANTALPAGATVQGALSGSQSLAVIGVPQDATGNPTGLNLIAHELAHTLGLADEYQDSTGVITTPSTEFKNVWKPADPCYKPTTTATPTAASGKELFIPWKDYLACEKGLANDWNCDSDSDPTDYGCPRVWWPYHVTSSCSETPGMKIDCESTIGLYEGAYYTLSGIYRGAYNCRMRDTSAEFCDICKDLISHFFDCNYVHPGAPGCP